MSGKSTICERICKGFRILKEVQDIMEEEESKKMQAILYAFAYKFLGENELGKIKEETSMTPLGRMLMEDGIKEGIKEGIREGENLFAQLMSCLFSDNRTEDAKLAAQDEEARKRFYQEYGIIEK